MIRDDEASSEAGSPPDLGAESEAFEQAAARVRPTWEELEPVRLPADPAPVLETVHARAQKANQSQEFNDDVFGQGARRVEFRSEPSVILDEGFANELRRPSQATAPSLPQHETFTVSRPPIPLHSTRPLWWAGIAAVAALVGIGVLVATSSDAPRAIPPVSAAPAPEPAPSQDSEPAASPAPSADENETPDPVPPVEAVKAYPPEQAAAAEETPPPVSSPASTLRNAKRGRETAHANASKHVTSKRVSAPAPVKSPSTKSGRSGSRSAEKRRKGAGFVSTNPY